MTNQKTLIVQQWRSLARTTDHQRRIARSLGLRRLWQTRTLADNECVRGMVAKIAHLVRIVEE